MPVLGWVELLSQITLKSWLFIPEMVPLGAQGSWIRATLIPCEVITRPMFAAAAMARCKFTWANFIFFTYSASVSWDGVSSSISEADSVPPSSASSSSWLI